LKNSILVHRKKETNTLYSINALNIIIMNMNNGVLDTTMHVPWENYSNSLLITNENGLNKINIDLYKIYDIKVKNK